MKYIIFLLIGIGFFFVSIPTYAILPENPDHPVIDDGTGHSPSGSTKTLQKVINILFFNGFSSSDLPDSADTTPTNNPIATPTPGTPMPAGTFKYYRQCNYRSTQLRDGCNMCYAGCGLTAAAGVLATLVDSTIDPPAVLAKYTKLGFGSGCYGSGIGAAKGTLQNYGLKTSNYLLNSANGVPIQAVSDDIRPYLKSGSFIFALTYFCTGGCGHFIVLTDIDENNNVTSYDPYYEPTSTSQPINYSTRKPFPLYRYMFAVSKN